MALEQSVSSSNGVGAVDQNAPTGTGINTPELTTKSNKPGRRSITDVDHLFQIIGNLQMARRAQNEKNGRIASKLNSERPYNDATLESEGLGYKSNFSTKPLSVTIGKVATRLVKAVQSARYLTSAQLPDSVEGAKEKTELFRGEVTKLIRSWPGWFDFLNLIATEDSTYGWTVAAWLDNQTWRPKPYRQDEVFMPDGTTHAVDSLQVICLRRFVQMHELAAFIEDREAAEAAGWDIKNTVEAINNAKPPTIPGSMTAPYTDSRRYEDAIRESSVSLTLANGAKQIEIYDVFATEITGKVSHYIVDNNQRKLLFEKEDRYEKVEDCAALFSYEQSNGKLMGSKGVGREIYEISGALDRARNEAVDRLQMAGKIIVQGPEAMIDRFKLTSIGNVAVIPEGFTISQAKIEPATAEFMQLDQLLTGLLDQIAGSVSPKQLPGERVTAAQVNLFAEREEEKRDDRDTRFIMQLASVIWTISRRAYGGDCQDADAKDSRAKLLFFMSEEELKALLEVPALETIEDFTDLDAQKIVMFAKEKRGDPLYNHRKLESQAASALIGPEFAEDVLLPENDPTEEAEQTRFQELENMLLQNGQPSGVSPRDSHSLHIVVLKSQIAQMVPAAVKGDLGALKILPAFLQHWADHLSAAEAGGTDKKSIAPSEAELKGLTKQIGELQAHAQLNMQAQANGMPPLPPGSPGGQGASPDAGTEQPPPDAGAGEPPQQ